MEALQSHNQIERTWRPPQTGRFYSLTASDEKWASYFGIGEYVETKVRGLYDVRSIETEDLIGYTRYSPLEYGRCGRSMDVPIRTCEPLMRRAYSPTDVTTPVTFNVITVQIDRWRIDDQFFWCWFIPLEDAEALIRVRWIESLGEDNINQFAHEARIKAYKLNQDCWRR